MLIVIAVLILIHRMQQLRWHACLHIRHCIALSVCCMHFVRSSKTINLLQEGGILFVSILLGYCIQLRHFVKHPQENIFPPFEPADGIEDFSLFVKFTNLTYHIFPFIVLLSSKLVRHKEIQHYIIHSHFIRETSKIWQNHNNMNHAIGPFWFVFPLHIFMSFCFWRELDVFLGKHYLNEKCVFVRWRFTW